MTNTTQHKQSYLFSQESRLSVPALVYFGNAEGPLNDEVDA
jgi:hypothetical protein